MANRCTNTAATQVLCLREEAVLRKPHILNQEIAVLRRSVGLPDSSLFGKIEPDTHTHTYTTTVTLWRMHAEG